MSFRNFVRAAEAEARRVGIRLPMGKLRDAISKAIYNRPYSAAIAADQAGSLGDRTLPPAFLQTTADAYRIDAARLQEAIEAAHSGTGHASGAHLVLRAGSLMEALQESEHPELKRMRAYLSALPEARRMAALMPLGTYAGIAAALAKFLPGLLERPSLRVAVYCNDQMSTFDHGRGFQLVRGFLETATEISFDIIQDTETSDYEERHEPAHRSLLSPYLLSLPPAEFYESPAQYKASGHVPDVVVCPYPDWVDDVDLIRNATWLTDALRTRIPVIGMGFDQLQVDTIDLSARAGGLGTLELYESAAYAEAPCPTGTNFLGRSLFHIRPSQEPGALVDGDWEATARKVMSLVAGTYQSTMKFAHLLGALVQQGNRTLAFGAKGRAVDIATGETFQAVSEDHRGLEMRGVTNPSRFPWTPMKESEVRRPYQRLLAVDKAFASPLFPPELRPEGGGLIPDDFLTAIMGEEVMSGPDGDQFRRLAAFMNGKSGVEEGLPMFVAANRNDAKAIRRLVGRGEEVDQRDGEGWTPLCEAAGANSADAASALLELGADPNMPTPLGHPPVTIALSRRHDATALVILEGGADIDQRNAAGTSARSFFNDGLVTSPALLAWYKTHAT